MRTKREHTSKYLIAILLVLLFSFVLYQFFTVRSLNEPETTTNKGNVKVVLLEEILDSATVPHNGFEKQFRLLSDHGKLPTTSTYFKTWEYYKIKKNLREIILHNSSDLSDESLAALLEFVSNGGTLFLPNISIDKRMGYFYGLKGNSRIVIDSMARGISLLSNFLPNGAGGQYDDYNYHDGLAGSSFSNEITVLATAVNREKFPLIVENRIGKGKVLLFNTQMDYTDANLNVLFSGILSGLEGIPYPVDSIIAPLIAELDEQDSSFDIQSWPEANFIHNENRFSYTVTGIDIQDTGLSNYNWLVYATYNNAETIENQFIKNEYRYIKGPFQHGYLYIVETRLPELSIDTESLNLNNQLFSNARNTKILNEYKVYNQNRDSLLARFEEQNAAQQQQMQAYQTSLEKEHKISATTHPGKIIKKELEPDFLTKDTVDSAAWLNYYAKMNQAGEKAVAWQTFKTFIDNHPSKENILFSEQLAGIYGYDSDTDEKYWTGRQYEVSDSLTVLKKYVKLYNNPGNQSKIEKALKKLYLKEPTTANEHAYLAHLIKYNPRLALSELSNLPADNTEGLNDLSDSIAKIFAEDMQYDKAYFWAKQTDGIPVVTRLEWLSKLNDDEELEREFQAYIEEHPDDDQAKLFMSRYLDQKKETEKAWDVAATVKDLQTRDTLKRQLNKGIEHIARVTQKELLQKHADLMDADIKKSIETTIRLEEHNYMDVQSRISGDDRHVTSLESKVSYTIRRDSAISHSIAVAHIKLFDIKNPMTIDTDNIGKHVYGISYSYSKSPGNGKAGFSMEAGVAADNSSQLYVNGRVTIDKTTDKSSTKLSAAAQPEKTGAAYEKKIYRLEATLNQENQLSETVRSGIFANVSHFTDGITVGTVNAQFSLEKAQDKTAKAFPFAEISYTKSNAQSTFNYPYFVVDKRFYTGGGVGIKIKNPAQNLNLSVEGGAFLDNDFGNFGRFRLNGNFKLGTFTKITTSGEFSTRPMGYSNYFLIGLSHIF